MKYFVLALVAMLAALGTTVYADNKDFQSVNSSYNQYAPDDLNSPYSSFGNQYSPNALNNPYSLESNTSKINIPTIQEEHDYHTGIVAPPTKARAAAKVKKDRLRRLIY